MSSQNIYHKNRVLYLTLVRICSNKWRQIFYLSSQALQNFLFCLALYRFSTCILCFCQIGWVPLHWVIFSPASNASSSSFLFIKRLTILQSQSFLIALTYSGESISLIFSTMHSSLKSRCVYVFCLCLLSQFSASWGWRGRNSLLDSFIFPIVPSRLFINNKYWRIFVDWFICL